MSCFTIVGEWLLSNNSINQHVQLQMLGLTKTINSIDSWNILTGKNRFYTVSVLRRHKTVVPSGVIQQLVARRLPFVMVKWCLKAVSKLLTSTQLNFSVILAQLQMALNSYCCCMTDDFQCHRLCSKKKKKKIYNIS